MPTAQQLEVLDRLTPPDDCYRLPVDLYACALNLRRRRLVESEREGRRVWWRITPAGLRVLTELTGRPLGCPGAGETGSRRVACPECDGKGMVCHEEGGNDN